MTILLLGLPRSLLSLGIIVAIASTLGTTGTTIVLIGWLSSGLLLFIPSVETLVARLSGLRRPLQQEAYYLHGAWRTVTAAAGVDPAPYSLWVEDEDEPNAFAIGGHIVAATRPALRLHHRELEAVLAHELGHHLLGHAWAMMLVRWYSWPAGLILRIIRFIVGVVLFIICDVVPKMITSLTGLMIAIGMLFPVLTFAAIFAVPFLLLWAAAGVLLLLDRQASRVAEFNCDRFAVHMNYGLPLLYALGHIMPAEGPRPPWRKRIFDTHPPTIDRIRAVERMLPAPVTTPYRPSLPGPSPASHPHPTPQVAPDPTQARTP